MIARYLGVRVWDLSRVAIHYQEEARVILQARHEFQVEKSNAANKAGSMTTQIITPEF